MKTAVLLEKIESLESTVDALLVITSALILAAPDKPDLAKHLRELFARRDGSDPLADEHLEVVQTCLAAHVDPPEVLH